MNSYAVFARIRAIASSVVVANREYESWLIAGASGSRGYRGLPPNLSAEANAETIHDAKGWFAARMENGYRETIDQPKLSLRFDLSEAQSAPSFRKLRRDLERLLGFCQGRAE